MTRAVGVIVDACVVVVIAIYILQYYQLSTSMDLAQLLHYMHQISLESIYSSFQAVCDALETKTFIFHKYLPQAKMLDVFSSLIICRMYRSTAKESKSYLEAFVGCLIFKFGGTTLSGLLLGQVPFWIMSNIASPGFVLAWWLTFCCPLDLFYTFFSQSSVSILLCELCVELAACHAITLNGVDKAVFNRYHDDIKLFPLACILCGVISGSAGGILAEYLGVLRCPSFVPSQTPAVFTSLAARKALVRAVLCATLYYWLLNPVGYLPYHGIDKQVGHHIMVNIYAVAYVILKCFGIDVFAVLFQSMLWVLCVPATVPIDSIATPKTALKVVEEEIVTEKSEVKVGKAKKRNKREKKNE